MSVSKEEIVIVVSALMDRYPAMRFGQLVYNVSSWAVGPKPSAVWDVTDEEWVKAAKETLMELRHSDGGG